MSVQTSDGAAPVRVSDGARVLRLPAAARGELAALAERGYPAEACGLLVGRETAQGTSIERVTAARNLATDRLADRYRLHPDDFLAADAAARRDGLDIVGIWHTHPDHPARPSRTDYDAAWEGYSYLILSVRRGAVAEVRAWRLEGIAFLEQPIEEVS